MRGRERRKRSPEPRGYSLAQPKVTQRELDLDSQARGRSRKEASGPEGTGVEAAPDTALPPPTPPSFSPRPESETGDTKVKLKLLPGSQARLQRGKERVTPPASPRGKLRDGGREGGIAF